MTAAKYKINLEALTASQTFSEASAEELRVLFALESLLGDASLDKLSAVASVSRARVAAALALFEDAGVIEKDTDEGVSYEFAERIGLFDPTAAGSSEVARDIRDNSLANMISECTRIMKRVTLPTSDIAAISALYTELGLSPEYILTLARHLATKTARLVPRRLCNKAEQLAARDIDTLEALEIYISENESASAAEWEFRRLLGIKGRSTSPSEREAFLRWSDEYGFGTEIVRLAYDMSVKNTKGLSIQYMDALLTAWHGAECKTVADCEREAKKFSADFAAREKGKAQGKSKRAPTADEPKYSDFNSEDALMQALLRSYGEENDGKDKS